MTSQSPFEQMGQAVGARLRAARLARKLTQSQLASPEFSVSYVSAIERGQIHPSLRALEIFAQRLGLSSSDLLSSQTMQGGKSFAVVDESIRSKEEVELQFLEAQLLVHQGAAEEAITQLRNLTLNTKTLQQKIQLQLLLGWAYYKLELFQESESALAEALKLVSDPTDFSRAQILNLSGMVYAAMNDHAQGFEYQRACLDRLEKDLQRYDQFFVAQVYTNTGLHYFYLENADSANEMFKRALSITEKLREAEQRSSMYLNASRYFAEIQKYSYAMLYGHKSQQLHLQEYCNFLRSDIYYYLGRIMLQGDQQYALAYLENLLQDSSLKQDNLTLASVTANIAELQLKQGNVDMANEHAQRAYELAMPYGDHVITASLLLVLGEISYARRRFKKGDAHFEAGIEMLERLDMRKEANNQSAHYAQLLEDRGKTKEALKYAKKAVEGDQNA